MAIPDVKVRLSPEGQRELIAALRQVQQEADRIGKSTGGVSALSGAFGSLRTLLPTLGLAGVAAAIVGIGKSSINTADEIGKMGKRAAASSENVSTLAFAARTADVDNKTLETGLVRLARSMGELRAGTGESVDAFRRLGISARDIAGLDTAQVLSLVAERLARVHDETERTELTLKVLGRNGAQLTPLLRDIAEKGFGALEAAAKAAGLHMSGEFTDAAEKFNDSLTLIKANIDGFVRSLVGPVLPALAGFTQRLAAAASTGGVRGIFSLLFTDMDNLKGELANLDKRIAEAGGTTPALDNYRKLLLELIRLQEEAALGARKLNGPQRGRVGFAEDEPDARGRVSQLEKGVREANLKGLKAQADVTDKAAEAELRLAAAIAETGEQRTIVSAIEEQTAQRRQQAAADVFKLEAAAIDARERILKERADQSIASDRERAATKVEIERQSNDKRLDLAKQYYDTLDARQKQSVDKLKAAMDTAKQLDQQLADQAASREQRSVQRFGAQPGQQQAPQNLATVLQQAREIETAMQNAARAGQFQQLAGLEAKLQPVIDQLIKLGGTGFAKSISDSTDALMNSAGAAQKAAADAAVRTAAAEVQKARDEAKSVAKEINELSAKQIKLDVGLREDGLTAIADQIRQTLASQQFSITVQANVVGLPSGSSVAGFAGGGRIPGTAPHPRADNTIIAATPGEFMHPVAAVRHYGLGMMESIRRMDFPRFADGGLIGEGGSSDVAPAGLMEHAISVGGRRVGGIFGPRDKVSELVDAIQRELG